MLTRLTHYGKWRANRPTSEWPERAKLPHALVWPSHHRSRVRRAVRAGADCRFHGGRLREGARTDEDCCRQRTGRRALTGA